MDIVKLKEMNKATADRVEIKKFWYENFSAEKNYTKFAVELKNIF